MLVHALTPLLAVGVALVGVSASSDSGDSWGSIRNDRDGGSTVTVGASDSSVTSGGSGTTGGDGGAGCQRADGVPVPCSSDAGWWSNAYNCYLSLLNEAGPDQPERSGEGFFRCDPGPLGWVLPDSALFMWLPMSAAGPDPAVLAQQAIDSMQLRGIEIGTAPPAGASLLVNAPVWLWAANPGATTWGPATATAAAGNVQVTATARAVEVKWAMGDGAVVTCGQGTPYSEAPEAAPSCSHTYRSPGVRAVRATTSWNVEWSSSTGVSGSETLQTFSTTSLEVREARALVTGRG